MDSEAKRQAPLDAVARHPEGISLADIETASSTRGACAGVRLAKRPAA